ncbi:MAG: 2Fe-2S iron-sulfur cluster-binding protein [Pseudomonadota bacterium]
MMVELMVDDRKIEAEEGSPLLQACLENGFYIPNLCFLKGMTEPPASCRMCFVEIEGQERPVTSCRVPVREGLIVRTDTPPVRRLQRAALELLLSAHDVDCANCPANKKCPLQQTARFLKVGLKPRGLTKFLKEEDADQDHPILRYHPNRCVLCGKCVYICRRHHEKPFLTFAKRGFETVISFYGEKGLTNPPCEQDMACVEVCPVAALTVKERMV